MLLVNQTSLIVAVVERGVRGGAHKHYARNETHCCGAKVRVQHDIAVCLQCGSTLGTWAEGVTRIICSRTCLPCEFGI